MGIGYLLVWLHINLLPSALSNMSETERINQESHSSKA